MRVIEDLAFLDGWFHENESCFIIPYIETHFDEISFGYQYSFMLKHLYFTKKIVEDYKLTNLEKIRFILNQFRFGKSKIVTIIGGRGQGKTATAMFFIEQSYKNNFHKNFYYIKKGERPEWLPPWINMAQTMEDVPNGSLAMLDETSIEYGSRNFYKDENKSFTDRLVILRHKDISIILVTQHSKLVDINIRRLSDILIYKGGADINSEDKKDDERDLILNRLIPKSKEESLVEIKNGNKFYLVRTELPEFWDDYAVSKTFRNYNPEEMKRKQRKHLIEQEMDIFRQKERIRAEEYSKKGIKAEQAASIADHF
jgi:hypothetical protein